MRWLAHCGTPGELCGHEDTRERPLARRRPALVLEAKPCAVNFPLVGRIAAVADAFDALTSDRVYRPALPHAEAARILREAVGSQFGPDVVGAFLDSLELDDLSRPGQG